MTQSNYADEGMWLMEQLEDLNLAGEGLEISIEDIYSPDKPCLVNAVINLGGGTAELVSPDGLVLTNHHVAYGGVQRASTQGVDYLTDGFLAATRADEIPAPGTYARILQEMRDVTDDILDPVGGIKDLVERNRAIQNRIRTIKDRIMAESSDIEVHIASMYNGEKYVLYRYQRFDDLRVVYMPPLSIGNYGADIDNWMWPRHTGDFAFLRMYMSPDGKGAHYDPDNIPYQADNWLKIASNDHRDGDFTFILGFPGRTNRNRSAAAIDYYLNNYYPRRLQRYSDTIDILDSIAAAHPDGAIRVAGMRKGRANYHKKTLGIISGMESADFLDGRIEFEGELQKYVQSKRKLRKQYGSLLANFQLQYDNLLKDFDHQEALSLFDYDAGMIPAAATKILYTVLEREKTLEIRDPKFSEIAIERSARRMKFRYLSFYQPADQALLKHSLNKALALGPDQQVRGLEFLQGQDLDQFIGELYATTKMTDPNLVEDMFFMSSEELFALNDPMIEFARKLYPEKEEQRERKIRFNAELGELRRSFISLLSSYKGFKIYPNANSTLRLTYGKVAGYAPRDAVFYQPFTTLSGAVEKDRGIVPFDMPAPLRRLSEGKVYGPWADRELGDVPIAFTHQCDITNGNSGSPVLNSMGELIGIAFDGNYEALLSDWKYNQDIQRAISVDIRYVMFVTEKYAGAGYLLEEMGVSRPAD